jgi:hypothetical protein
VLVAQELVHGKCGKRAEAVEVFAVTPQARYVLDDDGRYHETNVDESPESVLEEHVCQECGQGLSEEEVETLQELIADDDR